MVILLHLFGFRVNWKKSDLIPSQKITYLGFDFCTLTMTISLPISKVIAIQKILEGPLSTGSVTVKGLQRILGTLESTRPAVTTAPLHYRAAQALLVIATKRKWEDSRILSLSSAIFQEFLWWSEELLHHRSSPIRPPIVDLSLWTDAASVAGTGWGGHSSDGRMIQGLWSDSERDLHINTLETRAARLVVEALLPPGQAAALYIDNTTAIAYIRNFGGARSSLVTSESHLLWDFLLKHNSWVFPEHIAGEDNVMADFYSRHSLASHDYGLLPEVLHRVTSHFFLPQTDIFASPTLHVCDQWVGPAWHPEALAGNAFLLHPWPPHSFIFPPAPLLPKVVARLAETSIPFILLATAPAQGLYFSWYPILMSLLDLPPLLLGKTNLVCRMADSSRMSTPGSLAAYARL
jgi:hypothetical protein